MTAGKKILIADDEYALVNALDMLLTNAGYRIAACHTGKATIAGLSSVQPDLLILDLMMPLLNGLEILAFMRSKPEFTSLPVILIGEVSPQADRSALRWNLWLGKPFHFNQLIEGVTQLIGPP